MSVLHANWFIYISDWLSITLFEAICIWTQKTMLFNFQTLLLPYVLFTSTHRITYRTQWFDEIYFHAQTAGTLDFEKLAILNLYLRPANLSCKIFENNTWFDSWYWAETDAHWRFLSWDRALSTCVRWGELRANRVSQLWIYDWSKQKLSVPGSVRQCLRSDKRFDGKIFDWLKQCLKEWIRR